MLVLVLLLGAVVLTSCSRVPKDATKEDFCTAGEKFSALQKVPFSEGQKAVDRLADIGTPKDIDDSARDGFTELIDRMNDSDDAADFIRRTRTMTDDERKHLLALDTYIQGTCSDRLPATASRSAFCAPGKDIPALNKATYEAARTTVASLMQVGTPNDIPAGARLATIELIDRMNASKDADDFAEATRTMNDAERSHYKALVAYARKTC
ncbi:hypothetical protein [Marmoricola sp. OAE513]|uniref:hypothetical protein n=1 Tax=Marmoricola sp. OAE513 TaxID=2817894 RepID=UPI003392E57D